MMEILRNRYNFKVFSRFENISFFLRKSQFWKDIQKSFLQRQEAYLFAVRKLMTQNSLETIRSRMKCYNKGKFLNK